MTFDHSSGELSGSPIHYFGTKPKAFQVTAYNQYGTGTVAITIASHVDGKLQRLEHQLQQMQAVAKKLANRPARGTAGLEFPSLQCHTHHANHEHRRLEQEQEGGHREGERSCVVWLLQRQPISHATPIYYGVGIDSFTVQPTLPHGLQLNRCVVYIL
jgi:hypothetical protein